MKIRSTQRLSTEDFVEQKEWIGKVFSPINNFFSQCISILNQGITFEDNILGADHVFDFIYQTDALSFPIGFRWAFATPPRALVVVAATEGLTPVIINLAWQLTVTGQISVTSVVKLTAAGGVTVLTAGSRYQLRVRVTP